MKNYDFPTEIISLPSQGKCYPESNPLSKGTVEIKYMTRKKKFCSNESCEKGGGDR